MFKRIGACTMFAIAVLMLIGLTSACEVSVPEPPLVSDAREQKAQVTDRIEQALTDQDFKVVAGSVSFDAVQLAATVQLDLECAQPVTFKVRPQGDVSWTSASLKVALDRHPSGNPQGLTAPPTAEEVQRYNLCGAP